MPQIKKVPFPVDFSESCVGAARYVEAFAGRDENGSVLREFQNAFFFKLEDEESIPGNLAYLLSATPRQRVGS